MRFSDSSILTKEEVKARAKNSWDNGICYISKKQLEKNEAGEWLGISAKVGNLNILIHDRFVRP